MDEQQLLLNLHVIAYIVNTMLSVSLILKTSLSKLVPQLELPTCLTPIKPTYDTKVTMGNELVYI